MYFVTCPKQGLEMEAVVLHRVAFLEYFCAKQGQDFKPSAAPLYPNMGQVPPPGASESKVMCLFYLILRSGVLMVRIPNINQCVKNFLRLRKVEFIK